jgi:LPXTG-motif cell wall-anchored protein
LSSPLVVPVPDGGTAVTEWLPLGTYAVGWRAIRPSFVSAQGLQLTEDGSTVPIVACFNNLPRPHPSGRISINVIETGQPRTAPYTFRVVQLEPSGWSIYGPIIGTFDAVVTAGTTWTSAPVPASPYTISALDARGEITIAPNPVVLPDVCEMPDGTTGYCDGTGPPTVVSVRVGEATAAAAPTTVTTPRALPSTGGETAAISIAAAGAVLTGCLLLVAQRTHRAHTPRSR